MDPTIKFQDRKLNACAVCKTKKQLGLTASDTGHVYFLCRPHYQLQELLFQLKPST